MQSTYKITVNQITSPETLNRCAEILAVSFNEAFGDEWTHENALQKLTTFYNSPKFRGWVVEEGNKIIGGCIGNIETYFTGDYFYLKEMFIEPSLQRKGIGRELMNKIKEALKTEGIEMIILYTSNEGSQFSFYQRNGFNEMKGMRMLMYGEE